MKRDGTTAVEEEECMMAAGMGRGEERAVSTGSSSTKLSISNTACVRFSAEEDMVLVKEEILCKAHIAAYGFLQKEFYEAAATINQSLCLRFAVKTSIVHEKFSKIVTDFKTRDTRATGTSLGVTRS